jgi:hypothetical protein
MQKLYILRKKRMMNFNLTKRKILGYSKDIGHTKVLHKKHKSGYSLLISLGLGNILYLF